MIYIFSLFSDVIGAPFKCYRATISKCYILPNLPVRQARGHSPYVVKYEKRRTDVNIVHLFHILLRTSKSFASVPEAIRTPDLPLRRRLLYPAELRKHMECLVKTLTYFMINHINCKYLNKLSYKLVR